MSDFLEQVRELKSRCKLVYIYGAGLYGQNICKILSENGIKVDGFVVTKKDGKNIILGLPVVEFDGIKSENIGIVIGVNRHNAPAVKKKLNESKLGSEKIVSGTEYIDKQGERGGYDEIPTMEITTKIGCSVNCKFCPQQLLVGKYFAEDKERESVLSMDTFLQCLDKLPKECTILFSGMAEPFLNPKCSEMLRLACESGRKVDLYTTLVGADWRDIEAILELPIQFIGLHVADRRKYANIPISEDYYKKVDLLINSKRLDGSNVINACNSQTEPDERVYEICKDKYNILTTMLDRAGNLKHNDLFSKQCLEGEISCSLCGQKLNHNILLPDGTVLLCCMDYGMQHVLGNLRECSYEEIMQGSLLKYVFDGLKDESKNILCRTCSCANLAIKS